MLYLSTNKSFAGDLHNVDEESVGPREQNIGNQQMRESNVEDLVDVQRTQEKEEDSAGSQSSHSSSSLNKTQSSSAEPMKRTTEEIEKEKNIRLRGHEESRMVTTKR